MYLIILWCQRSNKKYPDPLLELVSNVEVKEYESTKRKRPPWIVMIQGYFNKENKDDLHSFLVFPNKVASNIFIIFHWNLCFIILCLWPKKMFSLCPHRFSSSLSILHRSTNLRTRSSHNEENNYIESYLPKHDSCGRWYKYFISCTANFAKEPGLS